MKLYAVTAAGGPTSTELASLTGQAWEALVPVPAPHRGEENQTCLEAVVQALEAQPEISHRIVVAPREVQRRLSHLQVEWVDSGPQGGENFLRGLRRARNADRVVWTVCDLPLASGPGLSDFLARCDRSLDLTYGVTRRASMQGTFPGYTRRYVALQEGHYTGGGLGLVDPHALLAREHWWNAMFGTRKNSFRIAYHMGWPILWGRLRGGTAKAVVEQAFSRMVKLRCRALAVDPRWSLDLDSPEDLHYLRWWVRRFPERA